MTKTKLTFVSLVNIQRFYWCKHILLGILLKNQYKWTKYKEKVIVFS